MPRTALVVGATGLVGKYLTEQLCANDAYSRVTVLVRKTLNFAHPKLVQETVDFNNLDAAASRINAQDIFCTLGTTIRVAGSQEAFRKVDFDYPVKIAELALKNAAEQYVIVTALGADSRSAIFYSRVKGEVEEKIATLGYRTFVAVRPSFLVGHRTESRFGEELAVFAAQMLGFWMIGPFKKYRAIKAETVARSMILEALRNQAGKRILESDAIQDLARTPQN
jgi:uncharacterized protein YbjT (DUF2867 family)